MNKYNNLIFYIFSLSEEDDLSMLEDVYNILQNACTNQTSQNVLIKSNIVTTLCHIVAQQLKCKSW